jgi:hypothetical protein
LDADKDFGVTVKSDGIKQDKQDHKHFASKFFENVSNLKHIGKIELKTSSGKN